MNNLTSTNLHILQNPSNSIYICLDQSQKCCEVELILLNKLESEHAVTKTNVNNFDIRIKTSTTTNITNGTIECTINSELYPEKANI